MSKPSAPSPETDLPPSTSPEGSEASPAAERKPFPLLFWLAISFEFFERGAYYGMMSILSVYFVEQLHFAKESVGVIKAVIQPILYFLPIVAGALADRFGYRRALMVAFALLGGGYFLTSRATEYTNVFLALVVMALGAGTFKPVISGTIAKTTDASNSTMGFGIYYWSINLGAFLFPALLVPYLKANYGWPAVMVAASICTGAMLVPTLLLFKDPPKPPADPEKPPKSLVRTVADAFEIIYSPFVLLYTRARANTMEAITLATLAGVFLLYALNQYIAPATQVLTVSVVPVTVAGKPLLVDVRRDQSAAQAYGLTEFRSGLFRLDVFRPEAVLAEPWLLAGDLTRVAGIQNVSATDVAALLGDGEKKTTVRLAYGTADLLARPQEIRETPGIPLPGGGIVPPRDPLLRGPRDTAVPTIVATQEGPRLVRVTINRIHDEPPSVEAVFAHLISLESLAGLDHRALSRAMDNLKQRPFFVLFLAILCGTAFAILGLEKWVKGLGTAARAAFIAAFACTMMALIWMLPGLSTFSRVLSSVIYSTLLSLFIIDLEDTSRFRDHFRFLLMIFIYSGFWVLYFQMFDSVLWYVKAYVDASSLDRLVNAVLGVAGVHMGWKFDVEHVTVINAGTIIALQLVVSRIVKDTKALPTMIVGITFATIGMAILAINTSIWVFILGTVIFSIGEMTAHPKFISYAGQTAPRERVATYMGYSFLYGVIGSGIGSVLGANLYVHYVDNLNQPRLLWLIFASIGVATIVGLLLFNHFLGREGRPEERPSASR